MPKSISANHLNKLQGRAQKKIINKTGYKNIESWLRNKLDYDPEQGDEKGIILTILELANLINTQEFPLMSSFPGDLASEITYSESVLTKDLYSGPKLSKQLTKGILLKIINKLTPFQAIIAVKRLAEGETQQNIADVMGCSHQYVHQEEKKLKATLFNNEEIRAISEKEGRSVFYGKSEESAKIETAMDKGKYASV